MHRIPDFVECESRYGNTRVEVVEELYAKNCQANIKLHSAMLCANHQLISRKISDTETIQCSSTQEAANARLALQYGVGDLGTGGDAGGSPADHIAS